MNPPAPSVLVVGAGAVGALFGSALARQNVQVSVVCRSDYDVVKRDGYDIRSPLLGDHRFRPHAVLREVAETCKFRLNGGEWRICPETLMAEADRIAKEAPHA